MMSDEIVWEVQNRETGAARARVVAKAGDMCCMPADIRHVGTAAKRAMLLVWENASPRIPAMIASGEAPMVAVTF